MKILIADKQFVYRDGLKHNLMRILPEAQVLGAESLGQVSDILRQNNDVDLILTDIDMLEDNWAEKLTRLLSAPHAPRIGVISTRNNPNDMQKAQNIGLCCFLPKNIESSELNSALAQILMGKNYYPEAIRPNGHGQNGHKLTNRQFEVLKYLAQGLSNKQIAYYMNVSEATVKLHINALLRAIEATNRTQAVVKSQKLGLI